MGDWSTADGRLGNAASWYGSQDWKILPVHGIDAQGKCTCGRIHAESRERGKHPAINSWNSEASSNPEQIATWWGENPDYNIGVFARESGFLVIDIDPRSGGDDSFLKLEERAQGALPPTVEALTGVYNDRGRSVRGRHLIYKCDPDEKFIGNFKSEGLNGIDVKHNGYILIAPSRHFSGLTYEWKEGHAPWEREITQAPEELLAVVRAKNSRKGSGSVSTRYSQGDWSGLADLDYGEGRLDIEKMFEEGIDEGSRAVDVYKLACALANKMGTDSFSVNSIETMMIRFNAEKIRPPMELEGQNSLLMHVRRAIDYVRKNPIIDKKWGGVTDWVNTQGMDWASKSQEEARSIVKPVKAKIITSSGDYLNEEQDSDKDSFPEMPDNYVGLQVTALAESGLSASDLVGNGNLNVPRDPDALSEQDGGTPGRRSTSDTGNGRRLIDTYQSVVRYSEGLGWFYWEGNYWKPDMERLEINELAKRIAAVVAGEVRLHIGDDNRQSELISWAKQTKSIARIGNMISSANSDKRIRKPVEQWDSDSHLIGVLNGVVDLKTGELLKGRPDLDITRRAAVSYTPGLTNVRWEQFINFATGGDKEYQEWLQRAVGYTLTGLNNQDVLFLVYGPPGSGKNTFVETIFNALNKNGYAWMLDSNVLVAGDGKKNSTDEYHMAELRGRRMIWIDELPEGDRLKENQVKKMTGSATLSARSPGEKPFTFESKGKLWITTNHRPIITDDAMWRRLRTIPIMNIPERPDPTLKEYLSDPEGGLPAVFAWAVEGAIKYISSSERDPLGWCRAVKEASDIYRKNEDRIGSFLDEEIVANEGGSLPLNDLFQTYRMWSESRGERSMTQIAFHRKLVDRGMSILGDGNRAVLQNYNKILKQASEVTEGETDWRSHLRNY
jgi:P4 family phage/plasmid primase-like protien